MIPPQKADTNFYLNDFNKNSFSMMINIER